MVGWLFSLKCDHTFTLTQHMWRLNLTSRMPLAQCIARPALNNWKKTHKSARAMASCHEEFMESQCCHSAWPSMRTYVETSDGVPQRDPLSTLMFATSMSLLMTDMIRSKAPNVSMVAYVDDTVFLGPAGDVTQAITEIQTEATT